jgi:hypothetical protein
MPSCLKDEPVKLEYNGFQPLVISDDWQLSTPSEQNMNEDLLHTAYQLIYTNERYVMARSLLVIRNGKIVAEAYPNNPDDAYRIENIQSCTKSFTSTPLVLHSRDIIWIPLTRPFYIYPIIINHQDKRNITIANALVMKTGINFINGDHTRSFINEGKFS